MAKESVSLDFIFRKINGAKNYPLEEIQNNDLMSKKHKKEFRTLNYFEQFLVFVSAVIGCVSILTFASLVGVPLGTVSSEIGLKMCAITAEIK